MLVQGRGPRAQNRDNRENDMASSKGGARAVLRSGWLRLTLVVWGAWVLWTMSQYGWDLDSGTCSAFGVNPLCYVWEFALPPVLALGAWWVVRGFGKEAVAAWAVGNRALLVIVAALVGSAGYLGAQVRRVERDVASVEASIDTVESTVGHIAATVDEVETRVGEVKQTVENVSSQVDELAGR